MTQYAIVVNNKVYNIIVADDIETALAVSPQGAIAIESQPSDLVSTDWYYDGEKLVNPAVITSEN
jgi:hypothetical protein